MACGAPVGPEGPLVHVGAGVASLCTRQMRGTKHGGMFDAFHNDADGRDFLSAGVAAGLAAAFGAPVGGVLFSLGMGLSQSPRSASAIAHTRLTLSFLSR